MAKQYVKELGDKNSRNYTANDGTHVKTIAPVYYRPNDYSSDTEVTTIQDALDNKVDTDDLKMLGSKVSFDETNSRLVLEDVIFDDIYPSFGKYGLATFPEDTNTTATAFSGDREWLLDWRPYLIDMSPVAGEVAKTPVAELKKNNWLRKIDGSYAPVVGITGSQASALDGKAAENRVVAFFNIVKQVTGNVDACDLVPISRKKGHHFRLRVVAQDRQRRVDEDAMR